MTTDVTSAVIVSLGPVAGVIVESLVLGERCPLVVKLLLGSGMAGAIIIAVGGGAGEGKDSFIGILFLLLSVIVGALFSSFSRKSSFHFKPMEITYMAAMVGTVVFNAVNIVRHIWQGTILNYFAPYFNLDNLIAFFFPEFGIILYFAWQNLLPAKSKSIGKVTLAAIIIRVVLALLGVISVLVITFAFGFPILEEIWEEIYWYF